MGPVSTDVAKLSVADDVIRGHQHDTGFRSPGKISDQAQALPPQFGFLLEIGGWRQDHTPSALEILETRDVSIVEILLHVGKVGTEHLDLLQILDDRKPDIVGTDLYLNRQRMPFRPQIKNA